MAKYSIKDLESLSGIKAHTLRIWEKRYGILKPGRTSSNIRYYNDEDLKKVLNIAYLNQHGIKISRIARLDEHELADEVAHLSKASDDQDNFINNLIIAMTELKEPLFVKTLSDAIIQMGFEKTVVDVLYPLLEKIGVMWQTGNISPAQEHFISNLIRQKLIAAIDSQNFSPRDNAQTFLLFLPEGELHEIGLLFYNFLIRKMGHHTVYLGQNVPFEDLKSIYKTHQPDHLVTAFITSLTKKDIRNYMNTLRNTFTAPQIFIGGKKALETDIAFPPKTHIISSANHLKNLVSQV